MARSLANFVVGIGADTSQFKQGMKEVNSGMLNVRTGALAAGAALATALTAVTGIAVKAASSINELDLRMQYTGSDIQHAYNLGNAVERMGGQASEAYEGILNMQNALNAFQREGESGKLEAVAILGIDPSGLFNMQNDLKAFQDNLADIVSTSTSSQKLGIQEIFGLSDATMRLLEKGSIRLNVELSESEGRTFNIEGMVEQSRELVEEWGKLKEHAEGFKNTVAEEAIPLLTRATKTASEIISGEYADKLREEREIRYSDKSTFEVIGETLEPIYKSTPIPHAIDSILGAFPSFDDDDDESDQIDSRILYEQSEVPVIGDPILDYPQPEINVDLSSIEIPKMLIHESQPEITHIQNNTTIPASRQNAINQPIVIQNELRTVVELDKRKIGESVTEYQEEQNFLVMEGLKGTTIA